MRLQLLASDPLASFCPLGWAVCSSGSWRRGLRECHPQHPALLTCPRRGVVPGLSGEALGGLAEEGPSDLSPWVLGRAADGWG